MSAAPFETPEEIHEFLGDLTPDDVGHERIGDHTVFFEGFTFECLDDLQRRQNLPANDPRHIPPGGPVGNVALEAEILSGWSERATGGQLLASGWTGDEENPTFYAVYAGDIEVLPIWR